MNWKPYPSYRPSGVEWLGDVPENWVVAPLKHRCRRFALYGANIASDEYVREGVRFLRTTDIDDFGDLQTEGVFIDRDQSQGYILEDGDILLSRSGTLGRAFVYSKQKHPECAYAGYLVRFVPSMRLNSRFFFYFTKSLSFSDWLQTQVIASTIGNVNGQKYAQCQMPLPERADQDDIADYLDRETGRIDRLVAKKRELIEKLKEKRAALISRTVTRGLNPGAKLKPSGVEWLGDVPEHWEVKRIRHLSLLKSGESITSEEIDVAGKYPVYGGNGLRGFTADFSHNGHYVLIGRQGALCGNVNYAKGRFWASEHAVVVKPLVPFETIWMGELLRSINLNQYSVSAAQPGLSVDAISSLKIPVPPLPEQCAIADFLDRETVKIDRMVAKVEGAIERLIEYRTALITAAVTGKIDVREAVT